MFVKGSSLAMLAFGNLGLSGGEDIDLLVPQKVLPVATELIARAGYCRFDPPVEISETQLQLLLPLRKDFGFIHQTTGLRVELHWRLFLNPHAMVEDLIMAASRDVPLTETAGLRTMGEEDLFAYLCMHGALHWWNRLKWLADINALLASTPGHGVEHLVRAAEARGAGRAAAQTLLLCRNLLGMALPARLTATLGRRSHGTLVGGDGCECNDRWRRRGASARRAVRDHSWQSVDVSSQPELALPTSRVEHPIDQPNGCAEHSVAAAAALSLPCAATTTLGVATSH